MKYLPYLLIKFLC